MLPTRKLPMLLLPLNEVGGGCVRIIPVSGELFWNN